MKNTLIHPNLCLIIPMITALIMLSPQLKCQDKSIETNNNSKLVLMGSFGYNSYKYELEYYGDIEEDKGVKTFINPRLGLFVGKKMIIGLGLGFSFLEGYPQQTYIYNPSYPEEGGEIEILIVSRIDLRPSIFLRFQNKLTKKLNYYIDFQAGMDFNLDYKSRSSPYYGSKAKEGNDFFSQLSGGVILNLNKTLALQSEIIALGYRADFAKDKDKPYTTLNLEYIFSNPNIGLVFYF